jgi:hypothetical protein
MSNETAPPPATLPRVEQRGTQFPKQLGSGARDEALHNYGSVSLCTVSMIHTVEVSLQLQETRNKDFYFSPENTDDESTVL